MSTLLVLTTGQTDVQLVVGDERREFNKGFCAALHDEIERRRGAWHLVDSPDRKGREVADKLTPGDFELCTPKLDAVLNYLDGDNSIPKACLVLETRRDIKDWPSDPRFAGSLLEERLRNKGVESVLPRTFLEGAERLEDPACPDDAVIRREVVSRIEEAIVEAIRLVEPSRVVVASTGGFPIVSQLVEEIVNLHASKPVVTLEVPDGARANPPGADRAVPRTSNLDPTTSFRARRRALDLINKGNLLGAWAVAEPLHQHEQERRWTRVIEWLYHFATSLPMPEGCEIPVLTHRRMAARAALRVELALRAGDTPRAVHGTVAFFESALWDHLGEHVTRHSNKKWFKLGPAPPENLIRVEGDNDNDNRKRPFVPKASVNGTDWYVIDDSAVCAIKIAKEYLEKAALTKLGQAVTCIRDLRNDVAHNEPTPALMEDAQRQMTEASLWSNANEFLTQPLVNEVLMELGVEPACSLCSDLLQEVRDRLLVASLHG